MQLKCKSPKRDGEPCQSWAVGASGYCTMHNPERRATNRETQRKGGHARSAARQAAKHWALIGEQMSAADMAPILRACMLAVKDGQMEPAAAQAIGALAKASVSIKADMEMDARLQRLEERAGIVRPSPLHRVK